MKVTFEGKNNNGFHYAVRDAVNEYFTSNSINKNANGKMVFKTIIFITLLVGLYGLIISNALNIYVMLVCAIALGMVQAFIGFNICHDAIHGSYSSNKNVNSVLSYLFNVIGANAYVWSISHNQIHHVYTNIPDHDGDLDVAPGLICLSPTQEHKPIMRYQHFYAFLLYSLTSLSWVLRKDFKLFFAKQIGNTNNYKHPKSEYFNLFFFKLVYYSLFIVVPLIVLNITWWQFLIGFLAMHVAEGMVLGLVFQLAHVVEATDFPEPTNEGEIEESWAVHQMHTTADFARKSKFATFFCGGLNFQIEHHLFPNICHIHYPEISNIVKKTALAHNVPYNDNPTFSGALRSHYRSLKRLGHR